MAREPPGHTLEPTALVHEVYLRLLRSADSRFVDRAHFFGAAARAMQRILVERARRYASTRHGGEYRRVPLDADRIRNSDLGAPELDVLALDEALERLARRDPAKAEVVRLRFFAGLTVDDTAVVLSISKRTVERRWTQSRAWLARELRG